MLSKNQKGFSMIEVMVASSLLAVAIYMGMNYIQNMQNSRTTRTTQSIYRYLAIQATQQVTMGVAFYPPIIAPNPADTVLYVACFDGSGVLVPNTKGNRDYQFLIFNNFKDDNESTGLCVDKALYEVRFHWIDIPNNQILINILSLKKGVAKNRLEFQNFKIFAK